MECISELKESLNVYFGWSKARMTCFQGLRMKYFLDSLQKMFKRHGIFPHYAFN